MILNRILLMMSVMCAMSICAIDAHSVMQESSSIDQSDEHAYAEKSRLNIELFLKSTDDEKLATQEDKDAFRLSFQEEAMQVYRNASAEEKKHLLRRVDVMLRCQLQQPDEVEYMANLSQYVHCFMQEKSEDIQDQGVDRECFRQELIDSTIEKYKNKSAEDQYAMELRMEELLYEDYRKKVEQSAEQFLATINDDHIAAIEETRESLRSTMIDTLMQQYSSALPEEKRQLHQRIDVKMMIADGSALEYLAELCTRTDQITLAERLQAAMMQEVLAMKVLERYGLHGNGGLRRVVKELDQAYKDEVVSRDYYWYRDAAASGALTLISGLSIGLYYKFFGSDRYLAGICAGTIALFGALHVACGSQHAEHYARVKELASKICSLYKEETQFNAHRAHYEKCFKQLGMLEEFSEETID